MMSARKDSLNRNVVPESNDQSRLSIKHLMIWSCGVAGALTIRRLIRVLEIQAQTALKHEVTVSSLNIFDLIVALGYGTGIALGILAILGGKDFWRDPGRILITILAIIAVLDFVLTTGALSYVALMRDSKVAGVGYKWFSPTYGYTISVLVMAFIAARSRTTWNWRLAWVSILMFGIWQSSMFLITGHEWLRSNPGVFMGLQNFFWANWGLSFFIGTTTAMVGVVLAILVDMACRRPVNWMTIAGTVVLSCMWAAVNANWVLK